MPTVNLSPLFNDAQLDSSGNPYSGAKLFTYAAGSSTKQTTYTTSAGSVAQANPIVLNSRGEPASPIWLTDGSTYKFVLAGPSDTDPPASPIRTIDNITGVNDISQSEWVGGPTPTYVSATTFTLVSDQTTEFHVGRRLKCTVTAGTVYAFISASAFTTLTTITVQLDSGSLDSGLSAVSYGINSAANPSAPLNSSAIINPCALTAHENLVVATASVSTATITADKVVVRNSAGRGAVLSSVSLTVDITVAQAANGRDGATENAPAWYYVYVIWNGATVAGLFSESATAPTLPSGYTHKGLVGAIRNDSGGDFIGTNQHGRYVSIVPQTQLTDGSSTSVASVSLAGTIPPSVWDALIQINAAALAATSVVASVWADSGGTIRVARVGFVSTTDAAATAENQALALLRTAETLWYSVSNANTDLDIIVIGYMW